MNRPLFRSEVSEHAQQAWLGRIILIRPMSFTVLLLAAGVTALGLFAYLAFGEYTKKSRVSGMLVPDTGLVKIFVQQPGVVIERFAAEGDRVARGIPLLVVGDVRHTSQQASLAAGVSRRFLERRQSLSSQGRLLEEMAMAERGVLHSRKSGLRAEGRRLEEEIESLRQRVAIGERSLERSIDLEAKGFLSPNQVDQGREQLLDQRLRLQALERSRDNVRRDLEAIASELALAQARAKSQLEALIGQRAALEQEQMERDATYRATLVAPQSGTIASQMAEPGQTLIPGVPVMSIVPNDSRLEAHLFAPSRAVGFVKPGQEVLLRYPAYPFQKFGAQRARILAISTSALPPAELGFAPPDGSREPMYRIKVGLDAQAIPAYGRAEPLHAGMAVEADILIDRRRLIEWVFEPLISLAGRA